MRSPEVGAKVHRLTYSQIAERIGRSESWTWPLVQRALADRADPRALRAAIANCEQMLRSGVGGVGLDGVLTLQARLRALLPGAAP